MTRVLVVEDSPTQAEKVRLILEGEGFEVETARDGQEGKEKLEASTVDLVLSDIVMPRLSGYELCRFVKEQARTKEIPVILLTALNDPMDIIQALEAGADNFISKPYEPDYLVARIRSILENRRLRPEGKLSVNVEMLFMGRRFTIGSGKEQILGLLLSAFEDMVRTNRDLRATEAELSAAKEKLEEYALKLEGRAQASEEMYATLMRQASDAILLFEEGVIIEANLQAASLAGRPVSEIVGRRAADFVTAAERGGMQAIRDKVAAERSLQAGDFAVERPDGSTVEVEASVSNVEVQGRKVNLVLLRDVTQKRHAERRAAAQQEVTQILAEANSLSEAAPRLLRTMCTTLRWDQGTLWQVDRETEALQRLAQWRGTPPLEAGRDGASDAIDPGANLARRVLKSREATWDPDTVRDAGPSGRAVTSSEGVRTRVGFPIISDHHIHGVIELLRLQVLHLDDALLQKLTSFGSQIGQFLERRRAEEALRESEAELREAQRVAHVGSWSWIVEPDIVTWSEEFFRIVGREPAGTAPSFREQATLYTPESLARLQSLVERAIRTGEPYEVDLELIRPDGTTRWIAATAEARPGANGQIIGLRGTVEDITEHRRLQAQLLHAQKMEAVGRLAGGIAHDFNNILTVIGGYNEMLTKTLPAGEPSHRQATEIGLAARRAGALTRQLLAFSRKQVLEPKVLDLNTIVNGILDFLRRLLGEDVEIVLKLKKGLRLVKADPGQIEQVIMNLAVNARDAMPQGGKLILETEDVALDENYQRAHPSVTAGPYVLLAASDTGCGMTPETVSHIFEPFFTTKEQGKGTGLGLSTAFGIVKQSGGEISVYSVPGEGTTFKIYLPRVSAETAERDQASSPAIFRVRRGQTVLLVEDDEAVARLTQSMLGDLGYEVLAATRGEEALEIAARHPRPIHLLLTDVVMPGLKGPEVATRLLAVHPEIRVVFMSGYAAESLLHQTAVLGTAVFLQKPFTTSALGSKLCEALNAAPSSGPTRALSILHMDDDRDILEITRTFLGDDGHRVVSCLDVEETVARYAEALVRDKRFDLVLLDLSIPGKKGGVEGMREILKLDPTAKIVACSGAGPSEVGPLESGFVAIVEKPFTAKSLKAILPVL